MGKVLYAVKSIEKGDYRMDAADPYVSCRHARYSDGDYRHDRFAIYSDAHRDFHELTKQLCEINRKSISENRFSFAFDEAKELALPKINTLGQDFFYCRTNSSETPRIVKDYTLLILDIPNSAMPRLDDGKRANNAHIYALIRCKEFRSCLNIANAGLIECSGALRVSKNNMSTSPTILRNTYIKARSIFYELVLDYDTTTRITYDKIETYSDDAKKDEAPPKPHKIGLFELSRKILAGQGIRMDSENFQDRAQSLGITLLN